MLNLVPIPLPKSLVDEPCLRDGTPRSLMGWQMEPIKPLRCILGRLTRRGQSARIPYISRDGQTMTNTFSILVLNARPAAGKSEIIHYLESLPLEERELRFHIGTMKILDDFPMLWTWFEEDDILEKELHQARLHSTSDHYFLDKNHWNLLIRRLSLEYEKWMRDASSDQTVIIEFSRGSEHGGYQTAYVHLSENILAHCASLYIQVSFEESLRKNRRRTNPKRPDSILEHALSDSKMERLYREDDWRQFSAQDTEYLLLEGNRIPYVIFNNEDDVTTHAGSELGTRLEKSLAVLWDLWQERQNS